MRRRLSLQLTAVTLVLLGISCTAVSAQQRPAGQAPAAEAAPAASTAPLFMKVEWVRTPTQTGQAPMVQENIVDPNVEVKWYGAAAKQLLTTGVPGSEVTPPGVWSGTCEGPFAVTFKLKNSFVDMTGLANVHWFVKTSGFHEVRPVMKLPDGTLLVADLAFSSIPMLTESQFSLQGLRWLKLDPDRIVTLGRTPAPNNETWVPEPDLSKVDEVGFVDLMPGSGHGIGGYIQLGRIEIFGKPVARGVATTSNSINR